jgi:hypothetical protein
MLTEEQQLKRFMLEIETGRRRRADVLGRANSRLLVEQSSPSV